LSAAANSRKRTKKKLDPSDKRKVLKNGGNV
jgi:hypothetical protein